jgi:hypothetical protein
MQISISRSYLLLYMHAYVARIFLWLGHLRVIFLCNLSLDFLVGSSLWGHI